MRPSKSLLFAAILAISEIGKPLGRLSHIDTEPKKCVMCGKPRYHNNSFCSAECCKQYKAQNNLTK